MSWMVGSKTVDLAGSSREFQASERFVMETLLWRYLAECRLMVKLRKVIRVLIEKRMNVQVKEKISRNTVISAMEQGHQYICSVRR